MPRALVCSIVALLAGAGTAHASKLHRIVPRIQRFASDGARYVAWEVPGHKPIYVLDTRTGRIRAFRSPCRLSNKSPAAAGRFLLECEHQEEEALLDVRTGMTRRLPTPPPHPYANYGPIWTGVGSRYVIGKGGTSGRCHKRHRGEECVALYEIATRKVSEVAESFVPDPDRPGAPPLCRGLRSRVLALSKMEIFEGLGPLSAVGSGFSYSDGLVAEPEGLINQNTPNVVRHIVLVPCNGHPTFVPLRAEPRNLDNFVRTVLTANVLTWDTGHQPGLIAAELESEPSEGTLRHGVLGSYNLRTHQRQAWALPLLRFHLAKYLAGEPEENVVGTFGYSTHTEYDVFWIAARTAECTASKAGCSPENEVFAIYEARL